MEHNDILSSQLTRKINNIEKQEAKINEEKKKVLPEIKKEFTRDIFIEVTNIIIESDKIYTDEQNITKEILKKEEDGCLEYDDYMTILRIYGTII